MKAIIWSKNNCIFCTRAKELLDRYHIEYEERNIEINYTKEDLLKAVPKAKTVPQIFIDGKHIGGYTELSHHFEV